MQGMMRMLINNLWRYAGGISCVVVFMAIAVYVIKNIDSGYIFNGDFALYIAQARSICEGTMDKMAIDMEKMISLSTYQRYSPVLYPWGYPLLLSPVYAMFGIDYTAFKVLSVLLVFGFLFFLYRNFRLCGNRKCAILLMLLVGISPYFLVFCNTVITELPFLCFIYASLYFINHTYQKNSIASFWELLFLGGLLFFTAQIRTEGYLLFPALFAMQCKKGICRKRNILPYLSAIICWMFFSLFFISGYTSHFEHFKDLEWTKIEENIMLYFRLPGVLLYCDFLSFNVAFFLICLLGAYRNFRDYIAECIFGLSCLLLIIIWPYAEVRYWLPIYPLMLFFFLKGVEEMIKAFPSVYVKRMVIFAIIIEMSFSIYGYFKGVTFYPTNYTSFNPNVESMESKEMFEYLQNNTDPDDVVACGESRAVYLYTDRLSCNISGDIREVDKVDWYVLFRNREGYLQYDATLIRQHRKHFKKCFSNKDFVIYKVVK